jgi:DNA-directed RNA polymerase specialized sigma24 family protein
MEEALRRMKSDVRPEHYAAFVASAVEGQDAESVAKLHGLSRDNLYQIRTRLTAKLRETVAEVLAEMDAPDVPGPLT